MPTMKDPIMKAVRAILDRIVLLCAVVAAGCIPISSFSISGSAPAAAGSGVADLSPFQEIANRYHGGSLSELIRYICRAPIPLSTRRARAAVDGGRRLSDCARCWRRSIAI